MGEGEVRGSEESGPTKETVQTLDEERCIKTLTLLEDCFTNPKFLAEVSDFIAKHALSFDTREEDHPIQWMILWKEYKDLIERGLEGLVSQESITPEELESFCEYIADEEPHALVSVDYLLASVDYSSFVELLLEHKEMFTAEAKAYVPEGRGSPIILADNPERTNGDELESDHVATTCAEASGSSSTSRGPPEPEQPISIAAAC